MTNLHTEAITGGSSSTPDFSIDLRVSADDQYAGGDPVQFNRTASADSADSLYWDGIEAGDSVVIDIPSIVFSPLPSHF